MTSLYFTVAGIPAPQGSKRFVGNGRMIESSKALRPWRAEVKAEALIAARRDKLPVPFAGPLEAVVAFTLPRPRSAPRRQILPDRRPDVDKLLRAVLDALTDAAVIEDDAQIVRVLVTKAYPLMWPDGMDTPGVSVTIRSCEVPETWPGAA